MTIIALHGGDVPIGEFYPESRVVGANREECIAALHGQCSYAQDLGISMREQDGIEIYTLVGGYIR
jgi:hypothetical protein